MGTITPTEFPAGTRVVSKMSGSRATVTGWWRGNICVRWDEGGTHSAPAHHMAFVHEAEYDAEVRKEQAKILKRMSDDSAANGDYESAAALSALIEEA